MKCHALYCPASQSNTSASRRQRRYSVVDMTLNYYQLLHVLPDAPAPVIKASYRAMMQKMRLHPDLGGDPSRAQMLNEAVDTLCNPSRRASYDAELQASNRKLNQKNDPPTDGAEGTSPHTGSSSTRKDGKSDTPGGRPNGYEHRTERPEETVNPEPGQDRTAAVPPTSLPTRPHCLFCKASFSAAPRTHHYYQSDEHCLQCQAPTAALEQLSASTTEELRRIYRHDHHALVRLWTHWPAESHVEARLQDLSLAGCAIESNTALESNTMVLLDTDALKAICQVRYCKPVHGREVFTIGLAFKTLKTKARPGTMFSAVA